MTNTLLQKFNTPFNSIPFEDIKQEDFELAIEKSLEIARNEIQEIVENKETPNFNNTIIALEKSGKQLGIVQTVLSNLCSAETNDFLDAVLEKVSPLLAAFGNDVLLNEELFNKVKSVYESSEKEHLNTERKRLLEKTYNQFKRNGALLSEDKKEKLRQIDQELAILSVKFAQNVLKEINAFELHITNEKDIDGLPEAAKIHAQTEAQEKGKDGWIFTLQYPSYIPFMKFVKNRALREKLYLANGKKAFQDNEYNNSDNIKRIVSLKQQRAELLGFSSHADFVLAQRMAQNPETVMDFLNTLLDKAHQFGIKDIENLKPLAAQDGIQELMPYDHAFYAEKLKEQKFSIQEEALKPYFSLQNVLNAAFDLAGKLYGLTFTERKDIQKYHEDVQVFEVLENGEYKALFYADFFPRKGKRAGAWMTDFKGQYKENGVNHRPHISIVCNFSKPTENQPSLLTFNEVTTLFHEFGHALHGMLADTEFESLSGTNVYWDFVELPSQFMENFCYEKEFLQTFARHYKTGESLPDSELEKIVASANFMEGYQTLRQLSFGFLDMAYHTGKYNDEMGIEAFEEDIFKTTALYPHYKGTAMSPSFSHIFAGGYSSGYYSYKWSEVLDADAFSLFKEKGIFDSETAGKFKTLLSKGGTENPMDLFVAFRGREPKVDALLERAGLKN